LQARQEGLADAGQPGGGLYGQIPPAPDLPDALADGLVFRRYVGSGRLICVRWRGDILGHVDSTPVGHPRPLPRRGTTGGRSGRTRADLLPVAKRTRTPAPWIASSTAACPARWVGGQTQLAAGHGA